MKEKEIVGYKLKKDYKYCRKAAEEIIGFSNPSDSEEYFASFFKNDSDGAFVKELKNAGVLDLWFEPIYKNSIPDIKAGDYIYIIDAKGAGRENHNKIYNGDILKVIAFKDEELEHLDLYDSYWLNHDPASFSGGGFRVHESAWEYGVHFRKATQEEIKDKLKEDFINKTDIDIGSSVEVIPFKPRYINGKFISDNGSWDCVYRVGQFKLIDNELYVDLWDSSWNPGEIWHSVKAIKLAKPKLTFGENSVTFEKTTSGVRISCGGEIGTLSQMEKIFNYYTKPVKFGSVELKNHFVGGKWIINDYDITPDKLTIGCTTGTWDEFMAILNEARKLNNE